MHSLNPGSCGEALLISPLRSRTTLAQKSVRRAAQMSSQPVWKETPGPEQPSGIPATRRDISPRMIAERAETLTPDLGRDSFCRRARSHSCRSGRDSFTGRRGMSV